MTYTAYNRFFVGCVCRVLFSNTVLNDIYLDMKIESKTFVDIEIIKDNRGKIKDMII
jgi:hypothetical protein